MGTTTHLDGLCHILLPEITSHISHWHVTLVSGSASQGSTLTCCYWNKRCSREVISKSRPGPWVRDSVTKKNFRTHWSRNQESLSVKQRQKHSTQPRHGSSTCDNRCNECPNIKGVYGEKYVGVWFEFSLGQVVLFVLIPGIFNHSCCHTTLSTVLKDFKVGLLIILE
jgi:hypothetical protein